MSLEARIFAEWLGFMREDHIPKVLATGCFSGYKICRILDESKESYSVSIQYFATTAQHFETYSATHAPGLQQEYIAKFGADAPAFRTILHAIEEGEVVSEMEPSKN